VALAICRVMWTDTLCVMPAACGPGPSRLLYVHCQRRRWNRSGADRPNKAPGVHCAPILLQQWSRQRLNIPRWSCRHSEFSHLLLSSQLDPIKSLHAYSGCRFQEVFLLHQGSRKHVTTLAGSVNPPNTTWHALGCRLSVWCLFWTPKLPGSHMRNM